jgi:hypothetical protein
MCGRHAANDYKFLLLKSEKIRTRDERNKEQIKEISRVDEEEEDSLFKDRTACRRLKHFALYF